jgi:hypothetical protein
VTEIEARFILGLPPTFAERDLKRAYRRAAAANHPDRGGSTERMVLVNRAYELLSDGSAVDAAEATEAEWSAQRWTTADAEAFYRETGHQAEPEHPAERYVRRVSIVLAAIWWITGIFDVLDEPRRLRPWILIGFPFAYEIVWPLVRFTVRCGIHVYNFALRASRYVSPFALR